MSTRTIKEFQKRVRTHHVVTWPLGMPERLGPVALQDAQAEDEAFARIAARQTPRRRAKTRRAA